MLKGLLTLAVAFLLMGQMMQAKAQPQWVEQGERLHYSIEWAFVKLGGAEFLYQPKQDHYQLVGRVWSNIPLFRVRDRLRIKGKLSNGAFLPDLYIQEQRENAYRAHKKMVYLREDGKAQFQNVHAGYPPEIYDLPEMARDFISTLFYIRAVTQGDIKKIPQTKLPIMGIGKGYFMTIRVDGKETLTTPSLGTVQTIKLTPVLQKIEDSGNIGEEVNDHWSFWVTADERMIPVRFAGQFNVGGFSATLQKITGVEGKSKAPKDLPEEGPLGEVEIPPHANPLPID